MKRKRYSELLADYYTVFLLKPLDTMWHLYYSIDGKRFLT